MKEEMYNPHRSEPDDSTASIRQGISATRDSLALTINALEARLNPPDLKEKIEAQASKVEAKAKALIHEELEALEAKARQGAADAAAAVKSGLIEAKEAVKKDLREAITDAKQSFRAATVGRVEALATTIGDKMNDTKDTLIETVRQNPIPATLVGAGLIWLLMNRSKRASPNRGNRYTSRQSEVSGNSFGRSNIGGFESEMEGFEEKMEAKVEKVEEKIADAAGKAKDAASGALHRATGAIGTAANSVATGVSSAANSVASGVSSLATRVATQTSGAAKSVAENAKGAAQKIGQQAGQIYTSASSGVRRGADFAGEKYRTTLEENPLLIAGAVLAIGAILGAAFPPSEREDSLMGPTRDRLLRRAADAAKDAAQSIADQAEDALNNKRTLGEPHHARA